MKITSIAILAAVGLWAGPALADAPCASSGDTTPASQAIVTKVINWTLRTEDYLKLKRPTSAQDANQLQAVAADWKQTVNPDGPDGLYRAALAHGINVQYETFMVIADPKKASDHRDWVKLEAARAEACLELLSPG